MDQLIPVLMIVGIVAFVMVRQIGKVTATLDTKCPEAIPLNVMPHFQV